jgi:signal peptidase I
MTAKPSGRAAAIGHGVRLLRVLGGVLLVAVVLVSVAHAVPTLVGAERSYVVTSGSMTPVLAPGDVIYVYDVSPGAVEEGDVITFVSGSEAGQTQVTTHRVVEIRDEGGLRFVTRRRYCRRTSSVACLTSSACRYTFPPSGSSCSSRGPGTG